MIMSSMISNPSALFHQSPAHPCTLLSFIFALGIVAILFLLSQDKFTPSGRLAIWIALAKLTLCTEILFLIALMHHIIGVICSWLPYGRRNDRDIESAGVRSHILTGIVHVEPSDFHHDPDEETWSQAPVQNVVTMLQMFLMEVLDRVWEDMIIEEGQEQSFQAIQTQAIEALPGPLQYCKASLEISSCCSDRCAICLEDFVDGESCRVFECKHIFHANCIDNWLKNGLTCPICRNSLVKIK
ncbi:E3 ubiquitin-protein ligase RNF126 [Rosa sericea]